MPVFYYYYYYYFEDFHCNCVTFVNKLTCKLALTPIKAESDVILPLIVCILSINLTTEQRAQKTNLIHMLNWQNCYLKSIH